jgi:hypothetical protein
MYKTKIAIACMAALAVLLTVQSAAAQGKLQGVWKYTEINITGPNARTITAPQPGLLIFTKKHVATVSITGDKPRPDLPQKDATDAQKVATWTPFWAMAGTYEVKGTTVTYHPIVAKNPLEPGAFTTLDYRIEGNTLSLKQKTNKAGPIANPTTMKLVRVE